MQPKTFLALQHLTPQHLLSKLVGKIADCEYPPIKDLFITQFIKKYQVDLSEAEISNPKDYKNFNTFFTRKLKANARPIATDSIVSPVDGTIYQHGSIHNNKIIQAKNHDFSLQELVGGKENIVTPFIDGEFITIYLSPKDYHRIHMPITGNLLETVFISGKLFSVNPVTTENLPNLFARNERLVCLFETELGKVAVILVGAMIVGSMATNWSGVIKVKNKIPVSATYQEISLNKGSELGYFQLGSTVIVLFEKNKIAWQENIENNNAIKMGSALAIKK